MAKNKCNCGKVAKSTWLIQDNKTAWHIYLCNNCEPKAPDFYGSDKMTKV